ncbi:type I-F CRISPR-associated protein Csy2 [Sulfurovum sp. bin170]|uniref:type I-F CRISPR-associated protein Csy2 n=1 Tax=Sulfurovum sp. bin170 TaxID=2695268 RepID=UPI0013DFE285|nr:type I-F CRISPR-associated protein Csy2 [Sulfurovum sp. bin170]NEW61473.1 type I-F CRISPR-associated protein Csy2 [Sulfurovum sp. bin170]
MIKTLLIVPHIEVHNANALSSPFTIGFPAMTAWLGAVHALQRKLNSDGFEALKFTATGVVSHKADLQVHKGVGDYVYSIVGTSNPVEKDGKRPAFIEESRVHLDVSLVIEFSGLHKRDEENFLERVVHHLKSRMKMAGGDIFKLRKPIIEREEQGEESDTQRIRRKLMPGYAIVERRDLMMDAMKQGLDGLDALLEYVTINHSCEKDDEGKVLWSSSRKSAGWIVPIATGFQGISKLGSAKNQRDPDTPHRFAESVVTLGEFKMPYKIESIDEILWYYSADKEHGLYLCEQNKNNS